MDEYLKNIGLSQAEFEQIRADFTHLLSLAVHDLYWTHAYEAVKLLTVGCPEWETYNGN